MRFSTWLEIDLDALSHNISEARARAGEGCQVLLVVKADAYGHGAVEVSRVAVREGIDALGVATLHEGIELRQAGIAAPIVILSPPMEEETDGVVDYELSCTVPSLGIARALSRAAVSRGKQCAVHVEVDTGMGRSGVGLADAAPFVSATVALLLSADPGLDPVLIRNALQQVGVPIQDGPWAGMVLDMAATTALVVGP